MSEGIDLEKADIKLLVSIAGVRELLKTATENPMWTIREMIDFSPNTPGVEPLTYEQGKIILNRMALSSQSLRVSHYGQIKELLDSFNLSEHSLAHDTASSKGETDKITTVHTETIQEAENVTSTQSINNYIVDNNIIENPTTAQKQELEKDVPEVRVKGVARRSLERPFDRIRHQSEPDFAQDNSNFGRAESKSGGDYSYNYSKVDRNQGKFIIRDNKKQVRHSSKTYSRKSSPGTQTSFLNRLKMFGFTVKSPYYVAAFFMIVILLYWFVARDLYQSKSSFLSEVSLPVSTDNTSTGQSIENATEVAGR